GGERCGPANRAGLCAGAGPPADGKRTRGAADLLAARGGERPRWGAGANVPGDLQLERVRLPGLSQTARAKWKNTDARLLNFQILENFVPLPTMGVGFRPRPRTRTPMLAFNADARLAVIREKIDAGQRLSFDDGVYLYESADLFTLGELANQVRQRK